MTLKKEKLKIKLGLDFLKNNRENTRTFFSFTSENQASVAVVKFYFK